MQNQNFHRFLIRVSNRFSSHAFIQQNLLRSQAFGPTCHKVKGPWGFPRKAVVHQGDREVEAYRRMGRQLLVQQQQKTLTRTEARKPALAAGEDLSRSSLDPNLPGGVGLAGLGR